MTAIPLLPCAWKQLFGISCPACGLQRALLLIAQGKVWESVMMFPVLFPGLIVAGILFAAYHRKQRTVVRWCYIALLTLSAFNLVYQNLYNC